MADPQRDSRTPTSRPETRNNLVILLSVLIALMGLLTSFSRYRGLDEVGTPVPATATPYLALTNPTTASYPTITPIPAPTNTATSLATSTSTPRPVPTSTPRIVVPATSQATATMVIVPSPTARLVPTSTVIAPTQTVPPAPQATLQSGGLGLTRSEWESTFRQPIRSSGSFFTYANGALVVSFTESRVSHIERIWGDNDTKTRNFAVGASEGFMPSDAKFVRTYTSRSGLTVDLYRSPSLAGVFSADKFGDGEPGELAITFRTNGAGRITSAIIAVGRDE